MNYKAMTREEFFNLCGEQYGTSPDYPFDKDFETAVFRHSDTQKWYAIMMKVQRSKFSSYKSQSSPYETVDVVNLKLPIELFGSFAPSDGVYPAYHMNKQHWISVILKDVQADTLEFLVGVSFDATKRGSIKKNRK